MLPSVDKNQKTALTIVGVVVCMVALSYAAVPLYWTFCQITGWGGTTQRAQSAPDTVLARKMTVQFDATTSRELPWRFKPIDTKQTLRIGETGLAYYEAENLSDEPVIGTATYNVSPAKAGLYFRKIACFCFTEQVLQPGEKMLMPVTYFIDPAIAEERNVSDVTTVTLSYTFYRNEEAERAATKRAAQTVDQRAESEAL